MRQTLAPMFRLTLADPRSQSQTLLSLEASSHRDLVEHRVEERSCQQLKRNGKRISKALSLPRYDLHIVIFLASRAQERILIFSQGHRSKGPSNQRPIPSFLDVFPLHFGLELPETITTSSTHAHEPLDAASHSIITSHI